MKHDTRFTVRLPEALNKQIRRDAKLLGKSPSAVIRKALDAYLAP